MKNKYDAIKMNLLIKSHAKKMYYGESGDMAPRDLKLSTRGRSVVSFTTRILYPRGKHPVPIGHRAG
jgi:hypothetical protein